MSAMASQITSLKIVYSMVYSGSDQRKHQSSASLAFVRGIHRWPANSPRKGPVTWKMFPFDDVIKDSKEGIFIPTGDIAPVPYVSRPLDDISHLCIFIGSSNFVREGQNDKISALVQLIGFSRLSDTPLPETMLTDIYDVTIPQWVEDL